MEKQFQKSLFLFRRDLRLEDNTGLIFALASSELVIPAFIFTPEQIDRNPFRSDHCLQFMIESLRDLQESLKSKGGKLFFFQGKPEAVVEECFDRLKIDALIVNRDYTPYSRERDRKLEAISNKRKIPFHSFDDALLNPPESIRKKNGEPYTVFTPYFRAASKQKVLPPAPCRRTNYFKGSIPFAKPSSLLSEILPQKSNQTAFKGGRTEGVLWIQKLSSLEKYGKERDFPSEECSSHLSPYLKFTLFSPREIYAAVCKKLNPHHELIRSLYWRDFFSSIAFFFPQVFKGAFRSSFDKIKWSDNRKGFERWCEGSTGFPIVDAGMREMNQTGFMHNRVRMIAASFLIKDLHIHWQWGEKYFAQTLIDYDPAVNNGNWQWVASTGTDSQPYFRIFNPWSQQKKFDPECIYIKKWIPELRDEPPQTIHSWNEERLREGNRIYPPPMLDHGKEAKKALQSYQAVRKK